MRINLGLTLNVGLIVCVIVITIIGSLSIVLHRLDTWSEGDAADASIDVKRLYRVSGWACG